MSLKETIENNAGIMNYCMELSLLEAYGRRNDSYMQGYAAGCVLGMYMIGAIDFEVYVGLSIPLAFRNELPVAGCQVI